MKLIMENWRKYLLEGAEKTALPVAVAYKGNWKDQQVAQSDADVNFDSHVSDFALLLDKLAELLGFSEPIITSGFRDPKRQVGPMVYLWDKNGGREDAARGLYGNKNRGSTYIVNLYTKCLSCNDDAGQTAGALVALWEKGANPIEHPHAIPSDIFDASADIIAKAGGISAHQVGGAVDYGINSNDDLEISTMLDIIEQYNLADIERIDERGDMDPQAPGPHWHVSVYKVTADGEEFLSTPNSALKGVYSK